MLWPVPGCTITTAVAPPPPCQPPSLLPRSQSGTVSQSVGDGQCCLLVGSWAASCFACQYLVELSLSRSHKPPQSLPAHTLHLLLAPAAPHDLLPPSHPLLTPAHPSRGLARRPPIGRFLPSLSFVRAAHRIGCVRHSVPQPSRHASDTTRRRGEPGVSSEEQEGESSLDGVSPKREDVPLEVETHNTISTGGTLSTTLSSLRHTGSSILPRRLQLSFTFSSTYWSCDHTLYGDDTRTQHPMVTTDFLTLFFLSDCARTYFLL